MGIICPELQVPRVWAVPLITTNAFSISPTWMSAPHYVLSMHLYTQFLWHTPFQPDFSNFHNKPAIFVFHGESASRDPFPFLLSILFCKWLLLHSELEPSPTDLSSPRSLTGKQVPYKSSLDIYSQPTGWWQNCRCPEGLNAAPPGTRVTLGHPKGLQMSTQGQSPDPLKHCPEKCRL